MAPKQLPHYNRTYLGITVGCSLTSQELLQNPKSCQHLPSDNQITISAFTRQLHSNYCIPALQL